MSTATNLEFVFSMMSHQMHGLIGSIAFNAKHENDKDKHLEISRIMTGTLRLAGVLSMNAETLSSLCSKDTAGHSTPLSILTRSLQEVLVDLTTCCNADRIAPYYLNFAKRQGLVPAETTLKEWDESIEYNDLGIMLQTDWQEYCQLALGVHGASISELRTWMKKAMVPLIAKGFESESSFEDYGVKATVLNVLFTELLKNAIKYSDPSSEEPIRIEWNQKDTGVMISCTNYSTQATRGRELSKGEGGGHRFMSIIVENLGGQFVTDVCTDNASVIIELPNW